MKLCDFFALSLSLLFFTSVALSVSVSEDEYLLREVERVMRSKYAEELDKPITAEGKEKFDRLFDAMPILNPDPPKRSKRATNEMKEGTSGRHFIKWLISGRLYSLPFT